MTTTRFDRYRRLLEREGAAGAVLTGEPAVQHASGVHLFTQRLMPQRPVALVVPREGPPTVVACVLELDQLAAEHPALALDGFREFDDDPWAHVAARLPASGAVLVEDTMPVAWAEGLRRAAPGLEVQLDEERLAAPRTVKDADEITLLERASRAAERALADGAAALEPGRSETEISELVRRAFEVGAGGRVTELQAFCIAPQNNRSMHHTSGATRLPARGPVRLGLVGRVDGYWMLICRMRLLGDDPDLVAAYARYHAVYDDGLRALAPGAVPSELYERTRTVAAAHGFALETLKTGHCSGLDFRERPCLSPWDRQPLEPGMVLAYDYCLNGEDGVVLHIEDRVLVTPDGSRRLSDRWRIDDPLRGHEAALGA